MDTRDLDRMVEEAVDAVSLIEIEPLRRVMRAQLRAVWNARGAADQDAIDASLSSQLGATAAGPYVKNLERALAALDWKT